MTEVERVYIRPSLDSLDLTGFQGFWTLLSARHLLQQTLYERQPNPQSFDWPHFASCSFHIASHPRPRRLGATAVRGKSLTNWIWWLVDKFLPPKAHGLSEDETIYTAPRETLLQDTNRSC